jgi:2-polyprenyl-3-methyl-5-hydroxy-6-metoxy-1,4-benzoquinol methylase
MRIDRLLDLVHGPSVLDVGCTDHVVKLGQPQWVHGRLRERFDDVTGIDISEENLASMRAAGFENLELANAETFDLGRTFDTVLAGELIEHLSNPGAFLLRAKAHLEPGGRLVLSTPYPFSIAYWLYALVKYPATCENREHTMWFCVRTLTELAERNGFDVRHFELVEDLDMTSPSRAYRAMVRLLRFLRPVLPDRLAANTMIFALSPREC